MDYGTPGAEVASGANTGAMKTCFLSRRNEGIPITIARAAGRFSTTVKGPCLYGYITASKKYAPFYVTALLYSQAAASQKTIVLTGIGLHLKAADTITLTSIAGSDTRLIDTGGVVEGVANTTVTVTVNLSFTHEAAATAFAFLADGTELSASAVVVLDDVDFSVTGSDFNTVGYNFGEFNSLDIVRTTNFVQSDNGSLQMKAI